MKTRLSRSFFLAILGVAWFASLATGLLWAGLEYLEFKEEIQATREELLTSKQSMLTDVVNQATNYIRFHRSRLETEMDEHLALRLEDAVIIVSQFHQSLRSEYPEQDMEHYILEQLRDLRFDQGRSFFSVFDQDGTPLLMPHVPDTENRPLAGLDSETDNLEKALARARQEGSASVTRMCPHPDNPHITSLKRLLFTHYEPLGWTIATGEYLRIAEEELKQDVIAWLEHIRYGEDGYVFAGTFEGISLSGPNKGQNMFDIQDDHGVYIVRELINTAREGGGFVSYVLPPFPGVRHTSKLSYTMAVEDWQWYVGAGIYVDDIEEVIDLRRSILMAELRNAFASLLLVLSVVTGCAYLLSRGLAGRLSRNMQSFIAFFNMSAEKSVRLDTGELSFHEFEILADSANLMVDERNKAQQALSNSRKRFKTLFDKSFELVGITDLAGRFIRVNQTALDYVGKHEAEVLGQKVWDSTWWRVSSPEEKDLAKDALARAAQGETVRFTSTHLSKDGRLDFFDNAATPLMDDTGDITQILLEGRDITDLKQAEQAITLLQARLTAIIDALPSMVVAIGKDSRISSINMETSRALGVSGTEALGIHYLELLNGVQDIETLASDALEKAQTTSRDMVPWNKGGEPALAQVTVSPLQLESGDTGGAVIRVDDVTERAAMESSLIQSEKMASLGGLAAGMAHEINNPLAAILGNVQMAIRRMDPKGKKNLRVAEQCGADLVGLQSYLNNRGVLDMLQAVQESGVRASKIVNNMLNFSRKSNSGLLPCDLEELWDKAVELASKDYDLSHEYDFKRITIQADIGEGARECLCEPNQLQQVFFNIVKNAAHALTDIPAERPPLIRFSTKRSHDTLDICIADNGPGMAPEVRRRILDPFYTTKSPGLGTGLGLSISFFIITRNHNGRMSVESTPGQGTTFRIALPMAPA